MVKKIAGEALMLGPRVKGIVFTTKVKKLHALSIGEKLQFDGMSITGIKAVHGPLTFKFGPFSKTLHPGPKERIGWGAIGFEIKLNGKAKAETGVLLIERWILARLRHHTFFSLAELNRTIADLLDDLNRRPFQKLPGSRLSTFEALDKPALKPLPEQPYHYAVWKKAKVGIDYHIEADQHYYSVPHRLVGKTLAIRISATLSEVLYRGQRVASHRKATCGGFTTLPEHMPKRHQQHLAWSSERFIRWGRSIGPCTAQVIVQVLQRRAHAEQGYRACLGLLNHARRYSKKRLEAACERALTIHSPTYRSITSILKKGLDQQSLEGTQDNETESRLPAHGNVRGSGYYH